MLAEARPSEAAVERCFKKHGGIVTAQRNRLSDKTISASVFLAFNYGHMYDRTAVVEGVDMVELAAADPAGAPAPGPAPDVAPAAAQAVLGLRAGSVLKHQNRPEYNWSTR